MADSVKIRITGDDSAYRKTLGGLGSVTKSVVKGISVASAAISAAWGAVGAVGVKYNAEIEQLQTSFEVMTGSAQKAASITERLRDIGAKTPFDLKGLASTTQLLMNYGFEADRAVDEMMMLGDIAQGNAEAMNSIAMGYAQMSSLGKVNLQDVKQMINGGFNPLQEISERTGESMESLYDRISKGKMAVSEITESMRHATSEGGKYFQSMEKQSKTFQGQLDTLKEDATAFTGQIMSVVSDSLRDTVIPLASEMLGEFSTAFSTGGFDGLIDAVTAKIPLLIDKAIVLIKQGISGLAKWLPGAIKQIATVIPNAVRAIVDLSPQIVSALFEVASSLVGDLITMLPELVPMILEGLGKMLGAISVGAVRLAAGVVGGIADLFITTVDEAYAALEKAMDRKLIADMSAKINTKLDVSEAESAITGAYDTLRKALKTDLLTEEQITEIENMIGEDYGKIYAKLRSFGLSDEDAQPIAESMTKAGELIAAVLKTDLLTEEQIAEIESMIGADYDTIYAKLKSFGLSDEDAAPIAESVTKAGELIASALKTDLLTEDQITQIESMIGESYDKIYKKLKSFGLSDDDAKPIAESVVAAGKTVMAELEKLDLKVKPATVLRWMREANRSRVKLRDQLKKAGLSQQDIEEVLKVYEKMGTDLVNGAPNLADEIYKALTDGKKDDKEELKNLNDTELGKNLSAIETWLNAELAKLDTDSADYPQKVAELREQAEAYKVEAQALHTEMAALIDNLANQPSSVVQAKLKEFEGYEERINALTEKLGIVNEQARTVGQRSYNLTRAGATTDTNTIAEGVQYAYQNYKLDLQKIEDEAKKAKEEADAAWEKGLMSDKEHREKESEIEKDVETKKNAVLEAYKTQFAELMQGIREAFGDSSPEEVSTVTSVGAKSIISELLDQFLTEFEETEVTPERQAEMEAIIRQKYQELLGKDVEEDSLRGLTYPGMIALQQILREQITESLGGLEGEENPYLTALEGIFGSEAVAPLQIDTSTVEGKMRTAMGDVGQAGVDGLSDKKDAMSTAASEVAGAASDELDASDDSEKSGQSTGDGWITGFNSRKQAMVKAAAAMALLLTKVFNDTLGIKSPSRAFMRSGQFSGQGWELGFKESMANATKTARSISKDLVNAVNLPARFSLPDFSQSITAALAAADAQPQPVYLDGQQIAAIQRNNNNVAITRHNRRVIMGYGGK